MPLTKRQRDILDFLRKYLQQNNYAPSLEEIANHFDIASLNAVYKHLQILEERGFISRQSNRARSIKILEDEKSADRAALPLLGKIAAGQPIDPVTNPDQIEIPQALLSRRASYVLEIEGDSMIEEQIRDGDLVVIEQREDANNGDTVVALIDGEAATLKKYYREKSTIRLQPANAALEPIFVEEERLKIQGVVVGLLRRY